MRAGPWRHLFSHTTKNLVGLHPAPLVHRPAVIRMRSEQNEKPFFPTMYLLSLLQCLSIQNCQSETQFTHFSVRKTSKVASYYLLPRLIVDNEIPNALMEQVGILLPNEVVFSHRQTKTKQQREALHKRALVRWVTCCPLSLGPIKTIQ